MARPARHREQALFLRGFLWMLTLAGERMLRIVHQRLHSVTHLRRMHTKVAPRLRIQYAAVLDQTYRLKLELSRKLPPLHDPPPVPPKHLTRCLRNRVQAKERPQRTGQTGVTPNG